MSFSEIEVKNPHSILMSLESRPGSVTRIQISPSEQRESGAASVWKKIEQLARSQKIPIGSLSLDKQAHGKKKNFESKEGRIGHSFAMIRPKESVPIEKLLQNVSDKLHRVWVALDSIQDPHNLGAIFRTASFFGVAGVILTDDRTAPISGVAYDASCGGIEALPFSRVTNLKQAIEKAKQAGLWVLGTSEHAEAKPSGVSLDRSWLVVFGNEQKGLRRLTLESCDLVCAIPRHGRVDSLNVSVATGIVLSSLVNR